jgi:hypothetical protein
MVINTTFTFDQKPSTSFAKERDLLGPLRGFVGNNHCRTWRGTGLNLIWRPNFGEESGGLDHFLQLNVTDELLSFTNITGKSGIVNRGLNQQSIPLGGLAYLQTIYDRYDHSGQHAEPGVWTNVPATTNPKEPPTVVRMGSVPHGTAFNLQGTVGTIASKPDFDIASILPFTMESPDNGRTGIVRFKEGWQSLAEPSKSRTPKSQLAGLTDDQFTNPHLLLSQAINHQTFVRPTIVLKVTSDTSPPQSVPEVGGGTDNIAFLTGAALSQSGPNANVTTVTATFWIERVRDKHGKEFDQLQYTQRVLLNFNKLIWPHITVGTLR